MVVQVWAVQRNFGDNCLPNEHMLAACARVTGVKEGTPRNM